MPRRLASLVAQLVPGEQAVRLIPAGAFRAADGSGRPTDAPHWRLDAGQAAILIARDRARGSRRVIDYEHQTLLSAQNGQPAPAAGWITGLEWRDAPDANPGLYATIEWTEKAAAMIAAGEYRYLSPVFPYDASGLVLDIGPAALTNNPGLDGLTDLAALSALYPDHQETPPMKELLKALGLADTAQESEAIAAVAALTAEVTTLKAATPDPAKYVSVDTVTDLQAQVATLSAQMATREVDELVQSGLSDGRILPAMEGWARDLGKKGVAELRAYLDKAQPIAALQGTQTGGKPAGDGPTDEAAAKSAYASNAALKAEFPTEADYVAFWKADRAGQIKNLTGKE